MNLGFVLGYFECGFCVRLFCLSVGFVLDYSV